MVTGSRQKNNAGGRGRPNDAPARETAALIACAPSAGAVKEERTPLMLPMGVRANDTITTSRAAEEEKKRRIHLEGKFLLPAASATAGAGGYAGRSQEKQPTQEKKTQCSHRILFWLVRTLALPHNWVALLRAAACALALPRH